MALEASHIRFALDLKDQYGVIDHNSYIVGALYPDSRLKSGTSRELTHPANYAEWDLTTISDFQKGWYTHLHCDIVQGTIFRELFPQVYLTQDVGWGSSTWVGVTALKVLQELDDLKKFNVREHLPSAIPNEWPHHENTEKMQEYFDAIRQNYDQEKSIGIDTYALKLQRLNLPEDLAGHVVARAHELSNDSMVMDLIPHIYDRMIGMAINKGRI